MNATLDTIDNRDSPPHPTHKFLWLVKREFWEHRGGFLWAPVITGGIFAAAPPRWACITAEVLGRVRPGTVHVERRARAINGST